MNTRPDSAPGEGGAPGDPAGSLPAEQAHDEAMPDALLRIAAAHAEEPIPAAAGDVGELNEDDETTDPGSQPPLDAQPDPDLFFDPQDTLPPVKTRDFKNQMEFLAAAAKATPVRRNEDEIPTARFPRFDEFDDDTDAG